MINQNNYNHFQKYYPTFINLNFNDKITILNQMKKMNFELFTIYKKAFHLHFNIDIEKNINFNQINNHNSYIKLNQQNYINQSKYNHINKQNNNNNNYNNFNENNIKHNNNNFNQKNNINNLQQNNNNNLQQNNNNNFNQKNNINNLINNNNNNLLDNNNNLINNNNNNLQQNNNNNFNQKNNNNNLQQNNNNNLQQNNNNNFNQKNNNNNLQQNNNNNFNQKNNINNLQQNFNNNNFNQNNIKQNNNNNLLNNNNNNFNENNIKQNNNNLLNNNNKFLEKTKVNKTILSIKNNNKIIPHFSNNIPRYLSVPKVSFEDFIYNKRIILVGPSNHVLDSPNGEWIEKFDIIIRLNKSLPIKPELYPFIGRRTDILYNNLNVTDYPGENKIDINMFLNSGVKHIVSPYPPIEPFTSDILNFIKYNKGIIPFRHIDLNYYRKIENKLGTRPNTGISAIADILNFNFKELYITGISLFKKNYYKQYRNLSRNELLNVANNSIHTQKPQKIFLRSLYLNDERIKVDNLLKEILYEDFDEFEKITRKYEKDTIFLNMNHKIIKENIYRKMEKNNKFLIFIDKNNLNKIDKNKYFLITDSINFPILDFDNILYLIGNFDKNIIKKFDIDIDIKRMKEFNLLVMSETKNIILKKWDKKNILEKIFFINKKLNYEHKRVMEKGHFIITNYIIYIIYLLGIIMKGEINIFRSDFEIIRNKITFYEMTLIKYLMKENKINILD
jgi:hypothetical protein